VASPRTGRSHANHAERKSVERVRIGFRQAWNAGDDVKSPHWTAPEGDIDLLQHAGRVLSNPRCDLALILVLFNNLVLSIFLNSLHCQRIVLGTKSKPGGMPWKGLQGIRNLK
jgi:hypothetical protein